MDSFPPSDLYRFLIVTIAALLILATLAVASFSWRRPRKSRGFR